MAATPQASVVADAPATILKAAAVKATALLLISASQHVQRMTLLVEAATARALGRPSSDPAADDQALRLALSALTEAMNLFQAAQAQARALGAE